MSKIKDGGPAFPATNYIIPRDLEERHVAALGKTQGMTLRDYFAAKATEEDIREHRGTDPQGRYNESREVGKFRYADAMLRAREVQP